MARRIAIMGTVALVMIANIAAWDLGGPGDQGEP